MDSSASARLLVGPGLGSKPRPVQEVTLEKHQPLLPPLVQTVGGSEKKRAKEHGLRPARGVCDLNPALAREVRGGRREDLGGGCGGGLPSQARRLRAL